MQPESDSVKDQVQALPRLHDAEGVKGGWAC